MRVRGIKVADIAIVIIAADDGIKPQTLEAINAAKTAEIPIIVAINKIDKASPAQIEVVKGQLSRLDLTPEDWGGQTVCMPISAKVGTASCVGEWNSDWRSGSEGTAYRGGFAGRRTARGNRTQENLWLRRLSK